MMKALRYISAAVAVIGLAACQSDDTVSGDYSSDPSAVWITASVGNTLTRSFPTEEIGSEKATQFKVGDKISVSTEDQSAATYVLDADNTWKPLDPNAYLIWNKESHTFTAYYPADTYSGDERTRDNQNGEKEIADADYMSFTGELSNTGAVNFTMERQTARIVIDEGNFAWGNQYMVGDKLAYEVKDVRIHANDVSDIVPYKVGTKYYALVNPGAANPDALFVSLRVGPKQGQAGTEETLSVLGIPELAASTSYNFQITVGKDKAELGKVTLEDWGTGSTLGDWQATDGYVVYDVYNAGKGYDIYTADGLLEVNKIMAQGNSEDIKSAVINLYTDVTLPKPAQGESNWTPMGTADSPILTFNGHGHTIKGLVINNPNASYQGFIGYCNDEVSNVTIEGCNIKGQSNVGGLVGCSYATVSNCFVKATQEYPVVIEATAHNIGGLIGAQSAGDVSDCSVICETGGSVSIKVRTDEAYRVGGLIGGIQQESTISNCSVINNGVKFEVISEEYNFIGGLVGSNDATITGCTVDGLTVSGQTGVGGFVGDNMNKGNITGNNVIKNSTVYGASWTESVSITVGSDSNPKTTKITDGGGNTIIKL